MVYCILTMLEVSKTALFVSISDGNKPYVSARNGIRNVYTFFETFFDGILALADFGSLCLCAVGIVSWIEITRLVNLGKLSVFCALVFAHVHQSRFPEFCRHRFCDHGGHRRIFREKFRQFLQERRSLFGRRIFQEVANFSRCGARILRESLEYGVMIAFLSAP